MSILAPVATQVGDGLQCLCKCLSIAGSHVSVCAAGWAAASAATVQLNHRRQSRLVRPVLLACCGCLDVVVCASAGDS